MMPRRKRPRAAHPAKPPRPRAAAGARRSGATARAVLLVFAPTLACKEPDPALRILAHRQEFEVKLKSWAPRGERALAELEVIPSFKPRIDTLTVRIVTFDAEGREAGSVRAPLKVAGLPVGLPSVVRAEFPPPPAGGSLGVEVEASPPRSAWAEFPELAGLTLPAAR
jgi:hypothetical protein